MLQKQTVAPATFELLKRLQAEPLLADMRLVGGTSLSLQLAHRTSVDLDLFTEKKFARQELLDLLDAKYRFVPRYTNQYTILGFIDDVKIDIIHHPYQWLSDPIVEDSLRLSALDDIAAMKIHAIVNSGERPKDFYDIAFLSMHYSYNRMKELALQKYSAYDPIMIDKSVVYFGDVNEDAINDIASCGYEVDWQLITSRIMNMTDSPDKVFKTAPLRRK